MFMDGVHSACKCATPTPTTISLEHDPPLVAQVLRHRYGHYKDKREINRVMQRPTKQETYKEMNRDPIF